MLYCLVTCSCPCSSENFKCVGKAKENTSEAPEDLKCNASIHLCACQVAGVSGDEQGDSVGASSDSTVTCFLGLHEETSDFGGPACFIKLKIIKRIEMPPGSTESKIFSLSFSISSTKGNIFLLRREERKERTKEGKTWYQKLQGHKKFFKEKYLRYILMDLIFHRM